MKTFLLMQTCFIDRVKQNSSSDENWNALKSFEQDQTEFVCRMSWKDDFTLGIKNTYIEYLKGAQKLKKKSF